MTARAVLERLLDATPAPPAEASVDELLAAFEAIGARRQAILDELRVTLATAGRSTIATDDERALVDQLTARQDAWRDVLAAAREAVCDQRVGVAKLRSYAAVAGHEL